MAYSEKRKAFFYSQLDGTRKKLERYTLDELRGINLYYKEPWSKISKLKKDQLITNIRGLKGYIDNIKPQTETVEELTIAEKIIIRAGGKDQDKDWYADQLFTELNNYGVEAVNSSDVPPGKLCFFNYSAKWPERYKWYDKRPLAYILEQKGDRMLGANFHYLRPAYASSLVRSVLNKDNIIYGAMPPKTLHTYLHSNTAGVYVIPEVMQEYIGITNLATWKFVTGDGLNFVDEETVWDSDSQHKRKEM
tara:strand:+ start:370 stop:1116 length:747 start_codon:yes stop_codon:yes gene_type:complete